MHCYNIQRTFVDQPIMQVLEARGGRGSVPIRVLVVGWVGAFGSCSRSGLRSTWLPFVYVGGVVSVSVRMEF